MKKKYHLLRRWLAKIWLKLHPSVDVIGVTGSYGKTNTAVAIATVLAQKFKVLQTDLNLDTIYNLPATLLRLRNQQKLVLEYGVDHLGEMDYHLALVKPKIAVVTGINPTHSDPELLGSLANIIKEKSKLIKVLGGDDYAVLNYDDANVRKMAQATSANIVWYGLDKKCDYWAENMHVGFEGTSFTLVNQNHRFKLTTGLIGQHFVYACLAAAAIGRLSGLSWKEVEKGVGQLRPLTGRLSLEKGPMGVDVLNDVLRANPASTMAGLQVLHDLPTKGKRIALLGEMGELGEMKITCHQEVGQFANRLDLDCLLGVGPLTKELLGKITTFPCFWYPELIVAAQELKKKIKTGDVLYLKGSRLRHMERVLMILAGEKIGCRVVSCHFYHHCRSCPYRLTGLK